MLLTCAHAVGPVGSRVRVFRPADQPQFDAVVVWRGTSGGRDDGALVAVDDPRWTSTPDVAVRWGRTATFLPRLSCATWGVPDAVQVPGVGGREPVEAAQLSGTLSPGDGIARDRYMVDLHGAVPDEWDGRRSAWGGLSGAALFCGELLVGVVAGAVKGWGNRRLTATPAYALHAAPGFTAVLNEHAAGAVLEPVEFQDIVEPSAAEHPGAGLPSPAGLLLARRAVVPFYGRTDLLARLQRWTDGAGVAAWLIHGPGGQGKTRLGRQLSDHLSNAGWVVAWLLPGAAAEDVAVLGRAARATLIVIDYAESRTGQLIALLTGLATRREGPPVRVLLLARTDGWWRDLAADVPAARDLIGAALVSALPELDADGVARLAAYRKAVDAFARALPDVAGQQGPDWVSLAQRLPDARLPDGTGALSVHMTALADLLDAARSTPAVNSHHPPAVGAHAVEDRLLEHEYGYWYTTAAARDLSPALSRPTLREAMAVAHLRTVVDRTQADSLLALAPGLADQPYDRRRAVRLWIEELYPPLAPGAPWAGLQPDRLAERFLGRQLSGQPELADALVSDATANQAAQLLIVYARAAAHPVFDNVLDAQLTALILRCPATLAPAAIEATTRVEHFAPLLRALEQIHDDPAMNLDELARLARSIPRPSHVLTEWAVRLSIRLADEHRRVAAVDPGRYLPDLATSLHNASLRLGDIGRSQEALAAISEAVHIRRQLAEGDPATHLPLLARSLNSLSVDLSDLDRRKEGLASITEAVEIQRRLAEDDPEAHLPSLALSLGNLAIDLAHFGRRAESLAVINEAVDIRRGLAVQHPELYLSGLALSLTNLALRLGDLGRREESLAAMAEAVDIQRGLAAQHPDAYLAGLATSLNNLSIRLGDLGRQDEGLAAVAEAVQIQRRLAADHPGAYLPKLVNSLNNLAIRLGELGRGEQCLAAIAEAVEIERSLAARQPDVLLPGLALGLTNLANALGLVDRRSEALAAITEAVEIQRRSTSTPPDVIRSQLAQSLTKLAIHLAHLGRREDGLAAITEALEIQHELAAQHPGEFLTDVVTAQRELSAELEKLGWRVEALNATREVVDAYRQLAAAHPDEFLPDLAISLSQFAAQHRQLGRQDEGLVALCEAIDIQRRLARDQPTTHQAGLDHLLALLAETTDGTTSEDDSGRGPGRPPGS
ncbi:tetratricopeptide repeat protein [Catellatospora sp. NPDC049133]|uniref:tetratricopeptide repeat protein n=1 Tax=Catellatospora sp. NPDC049133 TaxID=3155499 RepID=UPI0033E1F5C5